MQFCGKTDSGVAISNRKTQEKAECSVPNARWITTVSSFNDVLLLLLLCALVTWFKRVHAVFVSQKTIAGKGSSHITELMERLHSPGRRNAGTRLQTRAMYP